MNKFLDEAEGYVVRHEPEKTAEQIFVEFDRVPKVHRKFSRYLNKEKICIDMPRKSEAILERRKLFINWYVEQNNDRPLTVVVDELTTLVFASRTTIYTVLYDY